MKDHDDITCRELIDFIADYLDGTLTPDLRLEFDRHLNVCPSCVAYLDGYQRTISLGKAAFSRSDETVPASVPGGLIRAILAARAKATSPET